MIERTAAVVFWEIVNENDHRRRLDLVEEFNLFREEEEFDNWCAGQRSIISALGIASDKAETKDIQKAMKQASIDVPGWRAAYEKRLRDLEKARGNRHKSEEDDKKKAVKRAQEEWAANPDLRPHRVATIIKETILKQRSIKAITGWITPYCQKNPTAS